MQYEVNNNAELDNGVYHDFGKEEEEKKDKKAEDGASLDSKGNKKTKAVKQTELQMLDNMIKREESNVNFTGASELEDIADTDGNIFNVDSEPAELKPYEAEYEEGIPNTHKLKAG